MPLVRRAIRQHPAKGGRRLYANGATFERKVRLDLEQRGYFVVRSAGSRSPVDLVAVAPSATLLLQCKRDGRCSPAEREALLQVEVRTGGRALLVCGVRGGFEYRDVANGTPWNGVAR